MEYVLFFVLAALPLSSIAENGPTSIGSVSIGMSKGEYISALGIKPVNCNEHEDKRSEMKTLNPTIKTLCYRGSFERTGRTESILVSGIAYDIVEANYEASKFIKSVGITSKTIFYEDRLVSFQIAFPKVNIETLIEKYGAPKLIDNRRTEVCQNQMGSKFENTVGTLDAVWSNGEVNSTFRVDISGPTRTCADLLTIKYYIIEEPNKVKVIENAIDKYRSEIAKEMASESPF